LEISASVGHYQGHLRKHDHWRELSLIFDFIQLYLSFYILLWWLFLFFIFIFILVNRGYVAPEMMKGEEFFFPFYFIVFSFLLFSCFVFNFYRFRWILLFHLFFVRYSFPADIFSLGVLILLLMFGEFPFTRADFFRPWPPPIRCVGGVFC
jgi:serine/threonine protein kinase